MALLNLNTWPLIIGVQVLHLIFMDTTMDLLEKIMITKVLEFIKRPDFNILMWRYDGEDSQERLQNHGEVILELPDRVHVVPTKEHVSIGQLELSVQYLRKYKVNDDRLLIQFLWVVGSAVHCWKVIRPLSRRPRSVCKIHHNLALTLQELEERSKVPSIFQPMTNSTLTVIEFSVLILLLAVIRHTATLRNNK
jgi:hypothetical protein